MSIEKKSRTEDTYDDASEIDLYSFHEQNAGRLIIDPAYDLSSITVIKSLKPDHFHAFLEKPR
jgi:hypothetical protein